MVQFFYISALRVVLHAAIYNYSMRDLTEVLAFGTIGKLALLKAFPRAFSFGVHLLCDMYMEDTITAKLQDLRVRGTEALQYTYEVRYF